MHAIERTHRNREIMLRYLEDESVEEIAKRYGVTESIVETVLRRPEVQQEIDRLAKLSNEEHLRARVIGMGVMAFETIRDTMQGENVSELRFKAAKDLLDRHPLFKDRELGKGVGEGLGEIIIQKLGEMAAEAKAKAEAIDVTPAAAKELDKETPK